MRPPSSICGKLVLVTEQAERLDPCERILSDPRGVSVLDGDIDTQEVLAGVDGKHNVFDLSDDDAVELDKTP